MNQNSYYGAARDISMDRLRQIMKHLLAQNYLTQSDDGYAVLKLTEKSYDITVKGEQILLKLPKEKETVQHTNGVILKKQGVKSYRNRVASDNPELFEQLRSLRNEVARDLNVPAYVVFTDKSLLEMSTYLPASKAEMLEIHGVAQAKYERFGEEFMKVISEYKENMVETPVAPKARSKYKW